ncbi:MAG: DoxX family protein [Candidatus Eiseniibacteriota bacterium]
MRNVDLALLFLRVGVGLSMLIFHGYGKLAGGAETWTRVGGGMANLGITFLPTMWGLLAALSESVGSLLLILGVFTRPAAAFLAVTMCVATLSHLNLPPTEPSSGWKGASHALELLTVYVALLIAGPGKYAVSRK